MHLLRILEMLFRQFRLIMQVSAHVFIMATLKLWQLQKVPLRHRLRHALSCPCVLSVQLGGHSAPYLSGFMFQGHFTIKVSSVLIRYVLICVKRRIS